MWLKCLHGTCNTIFWRYLSNNKRVNDNAFDWTFEYEGIDSGTNLDESLTKIGVKSEFLVLKYSTFNTSWANKKTEESIERQGREYCKFS